MVTTLEQAKQKIATAKQQAQTQRSMIEERRSEAQKQREQISKQERKILTPSQQRLRSGLYSGLEGRKRRRIVSGMREKLGKKRKEIDIFTGEIKKFEEQELKPFESEISKAESNIKAYEQELQDLNIAKKAFYESKPELVIYGSSRAKEFYRQLQAGKEVKRETNLLPLSSRGLPETYIGDIQNQSLINEKSQFMTLAPTRDLKRTLELKELNPMKKLNIKFTGNVIKDIVNKPFLTTGSPKRITPIFSLKPKIPATPSSPMKSVRKSIKINGGIKKNKLKKKEYKDLFFSKKNKKDRKKKSIWEL